ncbi:MAG: hypothetical protein ACR2KP_00235 [Egibacteraceae bacterium]
MGLTPAGQQAWRQLAAAAPPGLDILSGGLAGFFTELLLFDLGGLQALLHLHGWRLPADEQALATGWIGAPWRLWHVDGSDAHAVLTLTDVVAGGSRRASAAPRQRSWLDVLSGEREAGRACRHPTPLPREDRLGVHTGPQLPS